MSDQGRTQFDRGKFVTAIIGGQEFAIDIALVQEIRGWSEPTEVPHAPLSVLGVINLRGAVLPVVNLAVRMKIETQRKGGNSVIVVVRVGKQTVGLLVDEVTDIISAPISDIQTAHSFDPNPQPMLVGMLAYEDRMIGVLASNALVAAPHEVR